MDKAQVHFGKTSFEIQVTQNRIMVSHIKDPNNYSLLGGGTLSHGRGILHIEVNYTLGPARFGLGKTDMRRLENKLAIKAWEIIAGRFGHGTKIFGTIRNLGTLNEIDAAKLTEKISAHKLRSAREARRKPGARHRALRLGAGKSKRRRR
jgi:hypothetical protein